MAEANRDTWPRRVAPAVALFLLAPLMGEYLLGNLKTSELLLLPFIAPLYGGGAVLIREVSRRAGRGYPTMLTLGLAYAIFEEAIVDQLLFNPDYFAGQGELMQTVIPGIGVDAWLTMTLLAMHAIWSIVIPIVIVEAIFTSRGREAWLGRTGLAVMVAVFVGGSAWLGYTISDESGFLATPAQLALSSVVVAALAAAAFMWRSVWRFGWREVTLPGRAPHAVVVGAVALAASSLYMLTELLSGWGRVLACAALATGFFVAVRQWSLRSDWSPVHTIAVAAGGVLTYAWLGAFMEPETGPRTTIDHVGTAVLIVFMFSLLALALRRVTRPGGRERGPATPATLDSAAPD